MDKEQPTLNQFFQGAATDITVEMVVDMLRDVHESQKETIGILTAHTIEFKNHIHDDNELFKKLMSAFPNGDTAGHERYHRATIEWIELRNRTVKEALIKATEVGFIAALGWMLYVLYLAFLKGPVN